MGRTVIVVYRPREGKGGDLQKLLSDHVPILQRLGLATPKPATMLKAADGCLIEIFEWVSAEAPRQAREYPEVKALWASFSKLCDYECPSKLKEFNTLFSEFETLKNT